MIHIQRNTVQRQIVFDVLKKLNTHPTIDEIYTEIHKEHPSISKTTIYRNLRRLAQGGLIRRVLLPDALERYDGLTDRHQHFRCKSCGSIFDVDIPYLTKIDETVKKKYNFHIDEHDIVFKGICLNCIKSK